MTTSHHLLLVIVLVWHHAGVWVLLLLHVSVLAILLLKLVWFVVAHLLLGNLLLDLRSAILLGSGVVVYSLVVWH